jgi:hypothetical protein
MLGGFIPNRLAIIFDLPEPLFNEPSRFINEGGKLPILFLLVFALKLCSSKGFPLFIAHSWSSVTPTSTAADGLALFARPACGRC